MNRAASAQDSTSLPPTARQPGCYAFGGFTLDPARRELRRGGQPVAINGKAFDALVCLVERAGTVVSRAELADQLWPSVVVEDNNLSQTVLSARRALGDSQDAPTFIATIPRRGYQFVAAVSRQAAPQPGDGPAGSAPAVPAASRRALHWRLAALGIALVSVATGALLWPRAGAEDRACSDTASFGASALCQQALELYRSRGGIGVSMPLDARTEIVSRLDRALALQPRFAEALAWRANVNMDALLFDLPPAQTWADTREALLTVIRSDAARALEIDPTQSVAQVTLARLAMYQGELAQARSGLERARAAHPRDSLVAHYAAMVANLGEQPDAALRLARLALDLDPRNPAPYTHVVLGLLALGRHEEARAESREMIRRAPNAAIGYINLARAAAAGGDRGGTLEAVRLAEARLDETAPNLRVEAALLRALAGEPGEALRGVEAFDGQVAGRHVPAALAGMALAAKGDHHGAYELLSRARTERTAGMDPMHLLLIRRNVWADPGMETPEWRTLRQSLDRVP